MSLWASLVMWLLPDNLFRPAIKTYVFMILSGATMQLLMPAHSPWPSHPTGFQQFMHMRVSYDPYVCFPSMHVALSILPALLSLRAFRSPFFKAFSLASAVLISLSTLTLKEHFLVDSVAGAALALATYSFVWVREWRSARTNTLGTAPLV